MDEGAQPIKITGRNEDGDTVGTRSDGARVVFKPASPDKAGEQHWRNITPSYVHKLYFAEQLSDCEIQACEMLQENHHEAGLEPRVCASYKPVRTGGHQDRTDGQEKHYRRYTAAVRSLGEYKNTVLLTVLNDAQPNSLQRLKNGLRLLTEHYGI